jgi:hypothetical protein
MSENDEIPDLFYRAYKEKRWFCAVAKNEAESGFLVTAYQTSAIKAGERIWPK